MSRAQDVVAFGELLWDIYQVDATRFHRAMGGAPANVAVGLARLGLRTSVVAGVGRDAFGDDLAKALRAEGVDARSLVRLPNRTGIAFVRRDKRGEPSFLFYRHETADMSLTKDHVRRAMAHARFVVLGTSTIVQEPLRSATARFVDLAHRNGATIALDLNVRAHLWPNPKTMRTRIARLARHAAIIKASSADLRALGGARFLRGLAPHTAVFVTNGARTSHAFGDFGEIASHPPHVRCIDATGGGDAFFAGVLAVLVRRKAVPGSRGWSDPRVFSAALRVGHMLGAKAVSKVGATTGLVGLSRARALLS